MAGTSSFETPQAKAPAWPASGQDEGVRSFGSWLLKRIDGLLSERLRSASPSELTRARLVAGAMLFMLLFDLLYLTHALSATRPAGPGLTTGLGAGVLFLGLLVLLRRAATIMVPALLLCAALTLILVGSIFAVGHPYSGTHAAAMLLPALAVYLLGPRWAFPFTLVLIFSLGFAYPFHVLHAEGGIARVDELWELYLFANFSFLGSWGLGALHSTARDQAQASADARLKEMHSTLVDVSRHAGMAEIATGVLHNVGNTLNSVNIATALMMDQLRRSRVNGLARAAQLLRENLPDADTFLASNPQGRKLPRYLIAVAEELVEEREKMSREVRALIESVEHIRSIVTMQQQHARTVGAMEEFHVPQLIDEALRLDAISLDHLGITIVREYAEVPPLLADRHRLLQILINLLSNARQSLVESQRQDKQLIIRIRLSAEGQHLLIDVADNGLGIAPEHMERIFKQGFTTKKTGHGFGLHISALAATEMKGRLTCASPGPGQGATFTLELPLAGEEVRS